jgi:large subunit ribosomal protein L15
MSDTLSKLAKPAGSTAKKTRRVRGFKPHFEGGQTPIQRRLPKRGFINPFSAVVAEVNVGDLEVFAAGANVDEAALIARGLVKGRFDRIKILGDGELTKAVTVSADAFSKVAAQKIQKAGGKVVLVGSAQA